MLNGKQLADSIATGLTSEVVRLKEQGIVPRLVIVGVAPDERAQVYIRMKQRRAEEVGIATEYYNLAGKTEHGSKVFVKETAKRADVHGIICQLPLAGWYDPQDLIDCIPPTKDVDGLTSASQDALEHGRPGTVPATPLGVIAILESADIPVANKTACVIGRSNLVGKPLAHLLKQRGARVLVAHKQTPDIPGLTLQSDIVISAAGSRNLVTADMIKPGTAVVDVGINESVGKLAGDVDFDAVKQKAEFITPVPGGVGPLTVIMLLNNVVEAAKNFRVS